MATNINTFTADDEQPQSLSEHLSTQDSSELLVAPAARKLAEENSINLLDIEQGSGQNGRILKKDVEEHMSSLNEQQGQEDELPDVPTHPTQQPGAQQFATKVRINLNGKRYQLTDIQTDTFGAIELVFDELTA